jgi:hypothetical protein
MAGEPVGPDDEQDLLLDDPVDDTETEAESPDDSSVEADEEAIPDSPDEVAAPTDDQQPAPSRQQPSRGERRFQVLTSELANEKRQREDMARRLDAILAQQRQPVQETPEARAQRHALMTPEERMREDLQNASVTHQTEMRLLRFQMQDNSDKTAFEAKAAVDPLYSKWKPEVERELLALRQQGQNVDREKLMDYLIGKSIREGRKVEVAAQRRAAQQRVQRQSVRPTNSGSDVQASRRERGNSLEKRLENQAL